MRTLKVVVLTVLAVVFGTITLRGGQSEPGNQQPNSHLFDVDEFIFRKFDVIKTVMPEYPEQALRAGAQGLFVAVVRFDEDGNFSKIRIFESPHPLISKAVVDALKQWKTRHLVDFNGVPCRIQSDVRFHFIIDNGVGRVENPSEDEQKTWSKPYREFRTQHYHQHDVQWYDNVFNP